MPITAAAIGAGAQVVGAGIDAVAQIGQNKKGREHQEYMYDKNNAYNTPVMQMQRFKEAGLNPHLIYGQGSSGNATVNPITNQEAPQSKFADISQNYIANRTQQAQVDNMRKALEVQEADKNLKDAQAVNALSGSAMTDQQRQHASELFETVVSQSKANLGVTNQQLETGEIQQEKLRTEINNILQSTRLSQSQQASIAQGILESKQKIRNLQIDGQLKQAQTVRENLYNNLIKNGINPNDPAWMRVLGQKGESLMHQDTWDKAENAVRGFFNMKPKQKK